VSKTNTDPFKEKLYTWERDFQSELEEEGRHDLSIEVPLEACRNLVNKIFRVYGFTPPIVKKANSGRVFACYKPWSHEIHLPKDWANEGFTVAHEAAHGICRSLYGFHPESHGLEFMRIYINILVLFFGIDALEVEESLNKAGLKAMDYSPIPANRTILNKPEAKAVQADGTAFADMLRMMKTYA
jgi:hypothetical protein